jgi:hypothetical protein
MFLRSSGGGVNEDQDLLELIDGRLIDGRSIHYSVDQPAVHGRLINVWARVYQLTDRYQTATRAIPISPPPPELRSPISVECLL